ncbi:hypothetical protein LC085_05120 [Bacillus tianshenii]|uniref:hypothetical protein n=1 Tax=Sutcliffiella tianshenii TaxID=1463404 RepID=UPI001CD66C2F|nr:hypothetical protein [Bacillus tianshenii]MCA1319289.1 hypothetical protein [Bacillus tianshenii]
MKNLQSLHGKSIFLGYDMVKRSFGVMAMKGNLKKALELQRDYYIDKLLLIGVYDSMILDGMTITELKNEYHYFYYDVPSKKPSFSRRN